ncbi:MAG TPA: acetyl-CoA carboxylase biotin carboxyl carrier protein subunit [Actinomycetota bacterium]|nr:acetyl-CoA carboxylase biotin carboxyl carrier protein subunit [Actinomycetota bacterium]
MTASDEPVRGVSALGFRLVVAPAAGKVRHMPPAQFQDGDEWIKAGQVVAVIEQGPSTASVECPVDGRLAGVLVRDGTPVLPGQPLLWIDQARGPRERKAPTAVEKPWTVQRRR